MSLAFKQVDVFTRRPFLGNPVAVLLGADELDPGTMQRIAAWTHLSETTFVLRPSAAGADYRLRIFCPSHELPFAGHPTIGSAHAALESGLVSSAADGLTQECGAGLLRLTVEGRGAERRLFVRVSEARVLPAPADAATALAAALGAPVATRPGPRPIDVGPVWLVARLADAAAVAALTPDLAALARLSRDWKLSAGVTVFGVADGDGPRVHVRSFAPAAGVPEDPVCGSGNAAVAAYLAHAGMLAETGDAWVASQGAALGRRGEVLVRVREGGRHIEIGGSAVTVIDGRIAV